MWAQPRTTSTCRSGERAPCGPTWLRTGLPESPLQGSASLSPCARAPALRRAWPETGGSSSSSETVMADQGPGQENSGVPPDDRPGGPGSPDGEDIVEAEIVDDEQPSQAEV